MIRFQKATRFTIIGIRHTTLAKKANYTTTTTTKKGREKTTALLYVPIGNMLLIVCFPSGFFSLSRSLALCSNRQRDSSFISFALHPICYNTMNTVQFYMQVHNPFIHLVCTRHISGERFYQSHVCVCYAQQNQLQQQNEREKKIENVSTRERERHVYLYFLILFT